MILTASRNWQDRAGFANNHQFYILTFFMFYLHKRKGFGDEDSYS